MDLGKLTIFNAVKKRMEWTAQRQEVLAQNIANADTPKFRAHDMKPYEFKEIVRQEAMQINMTTSGPNHLMGKTKTIRDFSDEAARSPYETSPDGNSVILEEQMTKMNETAISHRFTNEIYRKQLGLIKIALTGRE